MFSSIGIQCELPQKLLFLVIDFNTKTVTVQKEKPPLTETRYLLLHGDFHEKTLTAFCTKAVDVLNQGNAWEWSEKTMRDMIESADHARKFLSLWSGNLRLPLPFGLQRIASEQPVGPLPLTVLYWAFEAADTFRQSRLCEFNHSLAQYEGWDWDLSAMLRSRTKVLLRRCLNSSEEHIVLAEEQEEEMT